MEDTKAKIEFNIIKQVLTISEVLFEEVIGTGYICIHDAFQDAMGLNDQEEDDILYYVSVKV